MTIEELKTVKIGDIVICNTSFNNLPQKGWKGKIITFDEESVAVEWEKEFAKGHDCDGKAGKKKSRWYMIGYNFDLNESDNIIILDLLKKSQLEFEF